MLIKTIKEERRVFVRIIQEERKVVFFVKTMKEERRSFVRIIQEARKVGFLFVKTIKELKKIPEKEGKVWFLLKIIQKERESRLFVKMILEEGYRWAFLQKKFTLQRVWESRVL